MAVNENEAIKGRIDLKSLAAEIEKPSTGPPELVRTTNRLLFQILVELRVQSEKLGIRSTDVAEL